MCIVLELSVSQMYFVHAYSLLATLMLVDIFIFLIWYCKLVLNLNPGET